MHTRFEKACHALIVAAAVFSTHAMSVPLTVAEPYHLLDNTGVGGARVGIAETPSEPRQQFGALCVVFSGNPCRPHDPAFAVGTSGIATQQGVSPLTLNFNAADLTSNHWSRARPANLVPDGQWTLTFTNGPDTSTPVLTPPLETTVKMPTANAPSRTINGLTATFDWILPPGAPVDAVAVNIRDLSQVLGTNGIGGGGIAALIFRRNLGAGATSFSVTPGDPGFLAGNSLQPGTPYALEIQLLDTRNNLPQSSFTNVVSLSRTFVEFQISTDPTAPSKVFLPMVDTSGPVPVYRFQEIPVVAGQTIFIDPVVAVGFDYQIGPGDPNFGSVTLPTGIGDDVFDLWLWSGSSWFDTGTDLLGGLEFLFAPGGVDRFRITGIEPEALLDPFVAGEFTTGVSFVSDGFFNGTMTPLVLQIAQVSEPGVMALLITALAMAGWARRTRRASSNFG